MAFIRDDNNARKVQGENLVYNFQLSKEKYYPNYVTFPVKQSNSTSIIYLMSM